MAEAATLGVPAAAAPRPALTRRELAALLALAVSSGFQQGYFVPLFPIITDRYRIGVAALAWTVTAPALVAVVATPVLGVLGDRLGHARVLRATACVVAAGATLIAFAPDYPVLLCGRVLQARQRCRLRGAARPGRRRDGPDRRCRPHPGDRRGPARGGLEQDSAGH